MSLFNLAKMTTATTGTGTITLGSAVSSFLTFAQAGVTDGATVTYAIEDGSNREIGRGVYTSAGTTLTRTVLKSTNSNAAINLSGTAQVFITAAAEDFPAVTVASGKTLTVSNTLTLAGTDGSTLNVGAGGTLGTAAYKDTGTSGTVVPLLDGVNTWAATQTFGNIVLGSANTLAWSTDLFLARDAAGVLAQKNSTNAQTLRVYGTTTGSKYASIGHDGTDSFLDSSSGSFLLKSADIRAAGVFAIYQNGNKSLIGLDIRPGGGLGLFWTADSNIIWNSQNSGSTNIFGGGTSATRIGRAAEGIVHFHDGSSAGITFRTIARTPSQITADQNNYNPGGQSRFQRWSSDASRNVTGMTFTTAQVDGQEHVIWNVGAQNIVLQNENASSTAANRFTTSTGADLTLAAKKCAFVMYDGTTSRWLVCLGN